MVGGDHAVERRLEDGLLARLAHLQRLLGAAAVGDGADLAAEGVEHGERRPVRRLARARQQHRADHALGEADRDAHGAPVRRRRREAHAPGIGIGAEVVDGDRLALAEDAARQAHAAAEGARARLRPERLPRGAPRGRAADQLELVVAEPDLAVVPVELVAEHLEHGAERSLEAARLGERARDLGLDRRLGLGHLACRHVDRDAFDAHRHAVLLDQPFVHLEPERARVAGARQHLAARSAALAVHRALHGGAQRRQVVRIQQVGNREGSQVLRGVAQQPQPALAHPLHAAGEIVPVVEVVGALDEVAEARAHGLERRAGLAQAIAEQRAPRGEPEAARAQPHDRGGAGEREACQHLARQAQLFRPELEGPQRAEPACQRVEGERPVIRQRLGADQPEGQPAGEGGEARGQQASRHRRALLHTPSSPNRSTIRAKRSPRERNAFSTSGSKWSGEVRPSPSRMQRCAASWLKAGL